MSGQTRGSTYRCETCGGGIALHTPNGGPYGCPWTKEDVAGDLGLTPEQAARGWDDGSKPEPSGGPQPCPECVAGKHGNCDGTSWDNQLDEAISCPCKDATHG